jgi:hypothetical protein
MEDRADRQVAFQIFERFFHRNELGIVLPQQRGIVLGEVGPQQIASFPPPDPPQLLAVEGVDEHGTCLVHLDIDQAPCGARAAPSFISISSRGTSIAASSRSRFHSHVSCRLRIARSLLTRSTLSAYT